MGAYHASGKKKASFNKRANILGILSVSKESNSDLTKAKYLK